MSVGLGSLPCSVIVPTHNRGPLLVNALTTLAKQDCPSGAYEVIVVDDGSTDGTEQMVRQLDLPLQLTYARKPNRDNRAEARNVGARVARGDVVIFVDAEMLCPPGFIRSHLDLHAHHGPCAVCGWHWRGPSFETPLPADWLERVRAMRLREGCFPGVGTSEHLVPFVTANASCQRCDLWEVGLFDEAFVGYGHEDIDLGMRLRLLGRRLLSDASTATYHQHHPFPARCSEDVIRNASYYWRKHHHRRRILHLTDYFIAGGIERVIVRLARHLHGAQHLFRIVLSEHPEHFADELAEMDVPFDVVRYGELERYIEHHPVDLIHIHSPLTWLWPALRVAGDVPVVVTHHFPARIDPGVNIAGVICVSRGILDVQPGDRSRCRLIHPGTDPEAFRPHAMRADIRSALGIPADAFVIGTVGRIDDTKLSEKMMSVYIELARLRPNLHVLLFGTGPLRRRLIEMADEAGLSDRVCMPGTTRDVSEALEAFDVFVHAVADEPFGIAVLEAMAKGLPVVCGRLVGPRDIIRDGDNGFLCANAGELIERVLQIADGHHDLAAITARAQATARLFDDRRTAFKHKLFYDEVIDGAQYVWPNSAAGA